ncbi:type II toxin-antitoxin system RatA family toxin [Gordonia mangrovi]|nr:SRPBCC family protein [Gordonia mangrovi]UVF77093.1 SRPBCC family protein [Gordonia mangrovi]
MTSLARPVVTESHPLDGCDADAAFARLCDFETLAGLVDDVERIEITPVGPGEQISSWGVIFRRGVMQWRERDVIDHDARTISFSLIDGDLAYLEGHWSVEKHEAGCVITFRSEFDFGIPSMAAMLNPLAERELRRNNRAIIAAVAHPTTPVPS